jgi:hypothetical protein
MGWGEFLKYVLSEAAVIGQAPLIFSAAVIVVGGLMFVVARWAYSTVNSHKDARIGTLEAMIKLRDDQLSNKFNTTPPDEAKALIAALQDQVSKLQPRRLTQEQRATIRDVARAPAGEQWFIDLKWNGMASDAERYAQDFRECLGLAGWAVRGNRIIGAGSDEGLFVIVADEGALPPSLTALLKALEMAAIKYEIDRTSTRGTAPQLFIGFRPDG